MTVHEYDLTPEPDASFQARIAPWMDACFGPEISGDVTERNHRFLEEALELVQAKGCTADEAHQLVEYVFSRSVGEPHQEVGGVMVTLAALCLAAGLDMDRAANDELARIWTCVEKIRAKQAAKPKHSPLPEARWQSKAARQADEIKRLTREVTALRDDLADIKGQRDELASSGAEWRDKLAQEVLRLRAFLTSIATNTCCEGCQEAALVARAALKGDDDERA